MLSPVCLSSVTLVRPTEAVEIFGIFLRHLVPCPSVDVHEKFYGDRLREPLRRGGGVERKRDSQMQRLWTYQRLYLGNGARYQVS